MFIHVFFMFPETAGKPLEEVTAIFENPHGIKYIGTPAWKTHNSYNATRKAEAGQLTNREESGYSSGEKGATRGLSDAHSDVSPERKVVETKDATM